jgi:hypothetical protein
MSLTRLHVRLIKVEVQRRPWVVADILRRARQCANGEQGAFLLAALSGREQATFDAIMAQLTDAELEALIPPEMHVFLETLTERELEALVNGDPAAQRRVWRSYQRGRNRRHPPRSQ